MKRDMELVRELLFMIEDSEPGSALRQSEKWNSEWDDFIIAYHLKIMDEANLIENHTMWADNKPYHIKASIKWEGHNFLDEVRSETVWNKSKELIKEKGLKIANLPMDIIIEFVKTIVEKQLEID